MRWMGVAGVLDVLLALYEVRQCRVDDVRVRWVIIGVLREDLFRLLEEKLPLVTEPDCGPFRGTHINGCMHRGC